MAIPQSIERNIALPGVEQANFVKYLTKANLPISNSKTIAYQSLYHFVQTADLATNATTAKFFTGTYDQNLTNFPGNNFVLPQSQHFLVTAIQAGGWIGFDGVSATPFTRVAKGFAATDSQQVANNGVNTLFNATYDFTVNGIVMQKAVPLTQFDNVLLTQQRGRFELSQPILIPSQSDFSLVVSAKGNQNLNFDRSQVERVNGLWFELIGIGLI
ncbi:MAG: hypothetical protein HKN40_13220 [Winogradskyella sp.]|uniref:hypothetical protein n=1 Tax=Winogradskyella sp. TaxID=1883156 RepID=UPI0017CD7BCE|nr:hypothetical protein [Winogradskyella sp.]